MANVALPVQMTASANIAKGPGGVSTIFCSSSTSGTVTLYDDQGTGTTKKIVDTFNVSAGTSYPLGFGFGQGLNVVIGGTASITVGLA